MCFDEFLCGVCFVNLWGDFLVGFQFYISVVIVINYLLLLYLEILFKMYFDNDFFEEYVQFNDMLKFWYDFDCVFKMFFDVNK